MKADGFSKTDAELIARIDRREVEMLIHPAMEMPDELRGECPRVVPDWISSFKGIRRPWIASWCCVLIFVAAIALGAWPVGNPLGQIAFGLTLILGLVGVVGLFTVRGDLKYVQDGVVGSGRVLSIELVPAISHQGQVLSFEHVIELELQTNTGDSLVYTARGLPIGESKLNHKQARFTVNEYLPIVWLPGRFRKTASPWLFLSFNAEKAFVDTDPEEPKAAKRLMTALAVVLIFAVLIGNLVLFTTCMPLDLGGVRSIPFLAAGGLILGSLFFWLIRREVKTAHEQMLERNRRAAVLGTAVQTSSSHLLMSKSIVGIGFNGLLLFGFWLICGLTILLWAFGINKLTDQTAAADETVVITEVHTNNQDHSERITFSLANKPNEIHTISFSGRNRPNAVLVVGNKLVVSWHPGRLRMPWIDNVRNAP